MQWIIDNWLTVVLIGGMFAMHMFGHGHGGHGGHGGHRRQRQADEGEGANAEAPDAGQRDET